MKILIYGSRADCNTSLTLLKTQSVFAFRKCKLICADNYDEYIIKLKNEKPNIVIVLANGADGMEGVITVREAYPEASVIWFSDDNGFGAQSYRLRCSYFAEKPVTVQKIKDAASKCIANADCQFIISKGIGESV